MQELTSTCANLPSMSSPSSWSLWPCSHAWFQTDVGSSNIAGQFTTKSCPSLAISLFIDFSQRVYNLVVILWLIDWCCCYYFVKDSLVALLETLCVRIFFFSFVNIVFFSCHFFFWCAKSLTKAFLPPLLTRLLCLVVAIPLVCWLYMCACMCVPLYVHVKICR